MNQSCQHLRQRVTPVGTECTACRRTLGAGAASCLALGDAGRSCTRVADHDGDHADSKGSWAASDGAAEAASWRVEPRDGATVVLQPDRSPEALAVYVDAVLAMAPDAPPNGHAPTPAVEAEPRASISPHYAWREPAPAVEPRPAGELSAAAVVMQLRQVAYWGTTTMARQPYVAAWQLEGETAVFLLDRYAAQVAKEAVDARDLEVQRLAACSCAALGYLKEGEPIAEGVWSASLGDVFRLRQRAEAAERERDEWQRRFARGAAEGIRSLEQRDEAERKLAELTAFVHGTISGRNTERQLRALLDRQGGAERSRSDSEARGEARKPERAVLSMEDVERADALSLRALVIERDQLLHDCRVYGDTAERRDREIDQLQRDLDAARAELATERQRLTYCAAAARSESLVGLEHETESDALHAVRALRDNRDAARAELERYSAALSAAENNAAQQIAEREAQMQALREELENERVNSGAAWACKEDLGEQLTKALGVLQKLRPPAKRAAELLNSVATEYITVTASSLIGTRDALRQALAATPDSAPAAPTHDAATELERAADAVRDDCSCSFGEEVTALQRTERNLRARAAAIRGGAQTVACGECERLRGELSDAREKLAEVTQENFDLHASINSPHIADFLDAVKLEALHQRERWGVDHDAGKTPADWFWLLGYLSGKALAAANAGVHEKALHHTISSAACLLNWHANISGADTSMRPGIDADRAGKAGDGGGA